MSMFRMIALHGNSHIDMARIGTEIAAAKYSHACADWLLTGSLQKMVLVISSVASKEVLERWTFDIQTDKAAVVEG